VALHLGRWNEVVAWADQVDAFCDRTAAGPQELPAVLAEIRSFPAAVRELAARYEATRGTPEESGELARNMAEAALSKEADKAKIVETNGRRIRTIGGQHDHGLAENRAILQKFRQRALQLYLDAGNPEVREFLRKCLETTVEILEPSWRYEVEA
ncbi:MAG: hypothetical protein U1E27_12820, partial [Kiritimatiellia bacterium]|nr:hypothetical protein [Kiritimatiellia bacterium]